MKVVLALVLISLLPGVDYRKDFLPARNQGEGNCLAYSASALLEWRNYKVSGRKVYFDPEQIYDKRKDPDKLVMGDIERILNVKCVSIKTVKELKETLQKDGPCIINFQIYNRTTQMWKPLDSNIVTGFHSMLVVGYNNDGFILRNSWGAQWGDNGYCVFPYEDWKWKWDVLKCK